MRSTGKAGDLQHFRRCSAYSSTSIAPSCSGCTSCRARASPSRSPPFGSISRWPAWPTPPSVILQSVVEYDPLLLRIAQEVRRRQDLRRPHPRHRRLPTPRLRAAEDQVLPVGIRVRQWPCRGARWRSTIASSERSWSDEEKAAMEIVALALGDAIERSAVRCPCQRDHPHSTMLQASLDAIVVIDEAGNDHRVQSGGRAHVRLASAPR